MANAETIKKWVAALRSGEFSQARGALRKDEAFCCLGVACELYRRETGKGVWDPNTQEDGIAFEERATDPEALDRYDERERAINWEQLPEFVANWLDTTPNPDLEKENGQKTDAATMNDNGYSFTEIADAIERTLLAKESA